VDFYVPMILMWFKNHFRTDIFQTETLPKIYYRFQVSFSNLSLPKPVSMRLNILLLFIVIFPFTGCEIKVKTSADGSSATGTPKVRNGIEIHERELSVAQAYLQFEDGVLVPNDNKVELKQRVIMKLIIDGWKKEGDKIFAGASEIITTSDGQVIVNKEDLFADYKDGMSADNTGITLSAVINGIDKLYDYFLVSFRVWDKKGTGEITGSYKLYLK